ncbi:hypothetical protein LCL89_01190 [Halobacillus yeomjeoni]|uniref:Zn-ribbon containing protein n=1 Tax=Halobacillus yeomjeoni TaxID=311194 RepID=A0A931HV69_9BACI|nr:hypothetical protein [Halobacillus yeomjeoni]MBH0229968.1 hypothetical protein [Halobacillus yeomjeoni]MCA0982654.1 hypothetical protein [Halobacillus yeomjeoni]
MRCPNCNSKNLGKIGTEQYYCWNCFLELSFEDGKMNINQIEEDGSLSSLNDIFYQQGS